MENRRYRFACPHCKREIDYDRSRLDREIRQLAAEVTAIDARLSELKGTGMENQKKSLIRQLAQRKKCLGELKAARKSENIFINDLIDRNFRRLVKEKIGEEVYRQLRIEAEEELYPCSTGDLMRITYTHKGGKNVRKV